MVLAKSFRDGTKWLGKNQEVCTYSEVDLWGQMCVLQLLGVCNSRFRSSGDSRLDSLLFPTKRGSTGRHEALFSQRSSPAMKKISARFTAGEEELPVASVLSRHRHVLGARLCIGLNGKFLRFRRWRKHKLYCRLLKPFWCLSFHYTNYASNGNYIID
jgi:hypothetical protein